MDRSYSHNANTKSNYDQLHNDKALDFLKPDNINRKNNKRKSKNNVCSDWRPLPSPKSAIFTI